MNPVYSPVQPGTPYGNPKNMAFAGKTHTQTHFMSLVCHLSATVNMLLKIAQATFKVIINCLSDIVNVLILQIGQRLLLRELQVI